MNAIDYEWTIDIWANALLYESNDVKKWFSVEWLIIDFLTNDEYWI